MLEQSEITDTEHYIAEDQLCAFLTATQADTLKKLADDHGTDAREEVFKALRKALEHTPLWMLLRQGLKCAGWSSASSRTLCTRRRTRPSANTP